MWWTRIAFDFAVNVDWVRLLIIITEDSDVGGAEKIHPPLIFGKQTTA